MPRRSTRKRSICAKRNHVMCNSEARSCKWVEGSKRRFCRLKHNSKNRRRSRSQSSSR